MEAGGKEVRNKYYRLIKNRDSLCLLLIKLKSKRLQIDKSICAIGFQLPYLFL